MYPEEIEEKLIKIERQIRDLTLNLELANDTAERIEATQERMEKESGPVSKDYKAIMSTPIGGKDALRH